MNVYLTDYTDPSPMPVERLDQAGYESALVEARGLLEVKPASPLDAVIHGITVRLHTNNEHWQRFWSANWFAPDQWATLTGAPPPVEPQIHIYAVTPEAKGTPRTAYHHAEKAGFLHGDTPYGPLRSLALNAVARTLAEEEAVHWVRAVCVKQGGCGKLLLTAPNLDLAVAIPALMKQEDTHLISFDGVFIRYGLVRMVDGVTLLPTLIINEKGYTIPGYLLFPWLEECGYQEPRADARCLTLEGEEVYCFARDLDLGRAPEAFAYPLEQAWYVPTQMVAAQPALVGALGSGHVENVPPLTPEAWDRFGDWARQTAPTLAVAAFSSAPALSDSAPDGRPLDGTPDDHPSEESREKKVTEVLCRLRAAAQGRAMVPPEQLWPGHAGGHPYRPLLLEEAMLLTPNGPAPLDPEALPKYLINKSVHLLDSVDTPDGRPSRGDEVSRTLATVLGRAVG
jgi:hypothetical protein